MVFPWYVLPPHQLPSARTKPHALGGSYADGLRERNGDSGGNLYGEGVNGQLTWTRLRGTDVATRRQQASFSGA